MEAEMIDRKGQIKWNNTNQSNKNQSPEYACTNVEPRYSKFSESVRHLAPSALQCRLFCGGKGCKYESGTRWKDEDMVIKGLFSHWVTDSILAMARPNTQNIEKFDMIERFHEAGITSIINLQHVGEHAHCGFGLDASGFSYNPQVFMDQNIFFYNFIWDDYGVRSLSSILDMVKVMDFAVQEGKVSVHCHAGLGRTGVLIACYLIYSKKMDSNQAIHFVRSKRNGAIQTRGQIECVHQFYKFLKNLWIIFPSCEEKPRYLDLLRSLLRQGHLLHGLEAKRLRHIPKIVDSLYQNFKNHIDKGVTEKESNPKTSGKEKVASSSSSSEPQNIEENSIAMAKHLRRRDTPVMLNGLDKTGSYYNKKKKTSSLSAFSEGDEEPDDTDEIPETEATDALPKDVDDCDSDQPIQRSRSDIDIVDSKKPSESQKASNNLPGGASPLVNRKLMHKPGSKTKKNHQITTILESTLTVHATTSMAPVANQWSRKLQPLNHAGVGQHTIGYKPLFKHDKIAEDMNQDEDRKNNKKDTVLENSRSSLVHAAILTSSRRMEIADALTTYANQSHSDLQTRIDNLTHEMNSKSNPWELFNQQSMVVQVQLTWSWLKQLSKPVIGPNDSEKLIENIREPKEGLYSLKKEQISTVMTFIDMISLLLPLHGDLLVCILQCIGGALTFDNELTSYGLQGRTKLELKECFRLDKTIISTKNLPKLDKLNFTHNASIKECTICEYLYCLLRDTYLDK